MIINNDVTMPTLELGPPEKRKPIRLYVICFDQYEIPYHGNTEIWLARITQYYINWLLEFGKKKQSSILLPGDWSRPISKWYILQMLLFDWQSFFEVLPVQLSAQ
jgi:hypothetical protein